MKSIFLAAATISMLAAPSTLSAGDSSTTTTNRQRSAPVVTRWLAMSADYLGNWTIANGYSSEAARRSATQRCISQFGPPCSASISVDESWHISAVWCSDDFNADTFLAASKHGWNQSDSYAYSKARENGYNDWECTVVANE